MKKNLLLLIFLKFITFSFIAFLFLNPLWNKEFYYELKKIQRNSEATEQSYKEQPHEFKKDDRTEITKIGFYKRHNKITIKQIPQYVKKVPKELPTQIESLYAAFANRFPHHEKVTGFEEWDTSKIKDMSYVFSNNHIFDGDLSKWNTENVENMQGMFKNAIKFNNNGKPLSWNTTKVTSMESMFDGAKSFKQNLSSWTVDNVVNNKNFSRGSAFFEELNKKPIWKGIKEENDPIEKQIENPRVIIHPSPPKTKVNIPLTKIVTPAAKSSPTIKSMPNSRSSLSIPKANATATNQQSKKLSTPAIVGIVVGSQVVLTSLAVGTPYLIKRFKK
ncbi:BspA family leucine-rich repeat surface protein [Mycoplasma capricolum subsp. capricolum]|uniref:BspA family leucine-rich repeat surface protein n=1 Tax=Mycoplasma capricolum TaxID=2095 RepID=UPI003DA60194